MRRLDREASLVAKGSDREIDRIVVWPPFDGPSEIRHARSWGAGVVPLDRSTEDVMRRIHDVTVTLRPGMPTFPGEPGPELSPVKSIAMGNRANVSKLSLGLHTGTHVDPPRHFIEGAPGADALALDKLCGPARVLRIRDEEAVRVEELQSAGLAGVKRLLLQTRNGALWSEKEFRKDFVYLAPEAARFLADTGVVLVGIDYLSVEAFGAPEPRAHRTLLESGVVIVEGLDLRAVPPGDYDLWCLPLKVANGDGAPARVILVGGEEAP
jgi:arylformamidase